MSKALSRLDLVNKRIREFNQAPRGFFATVFGFTSKEATDYLQIKMPRYDVLRIETWIDDLCEVTGQTLDIGVPDLIALLYKDFLKQIRRASKTEALVGLLNAKNKQYFQPKRSSELQQVSMNHWARTEIEVIKREKGVILEIEIPRRSVARGEVLLMDLQNVDPLFEMSVEQLITILLLDFANEIKKGNDIKLFENFLSNLVDQ